MYAGITGGKSFEQTLKSHWFNPDYLTDQKQVGS